MMIGVNQNSKETVKRIPKGSVGVEIGVWKGRTSKIFLKKCAKLHMVDPWSIEPYYGSNFDAFIDKYAKTVKSKKPEDFKRYYNNLYHDICNQFKNKPVVIHRCTSKEFFENFTEKVDWVYIDGSHQFQDVLYDLKQSYKIVKPGGSIFGDDYGGKMGVTTAVNWFINQTGLPFDNFYTTQFEIKL